MTCNVNNSPAARTIDVWAGQVITFEWHRNARADWDDILDPVGCPFSTVESVLTNPHSLIAAQSSPTSHQPMPTATSGSNWLKRGLTALSGLPTSSSRTAGSTLSRCQMLCPANISCVRRSSLFTKAGMRKARSSTWNASRFRSSPTAGGYVSPPHLSSPTLIITCQLLPAGAAFPGTYEPKQKGILFDPYKPFDLYEIPGPPVWEGSWGTGMSGDTALDPVTSAAPIAATTPPAAPSTLVTVAKPAPSSAAGTGTGGKVEKYGQW